MKKLIVALTVFAIFHATATAETIVLNATPSSRVTSTDSSTKRDILSPAQQQEFRVLITKRNGRYYWSTRQDRELISSVGGAVYVFTDPRGGGYVKVFDRYVLPQSLRGPGPRFSYVEQTSLLLGTITYWGSADAFDP